MNISQNCLDIIKKWEGYRPEAYLDPVGIPTIGYGSTRFPDGRRVRLGDRISEAQAEAFLKFETDDVVASLNIILKGLRINQNQFDAIVSLCYNIGVGAFRESTVLRKLRENDAAAAGAAFMLWNKGKVNGVKKVLPGLTRRRADERALFERVGAGGKAIVVEPSPQDSVTSLEGFRDGDRNVIVTYRGQDVVEILELAGSVKEDLVALLGQYRNARSFDIAPSGKPVPAGDRVTIASRSKAARPLPAAAGERRLLSRGMSDNVGSDAISCLQKRLAELGFYNGDADGDFGPLTDAAVRAFQTEAFGIAEADGKVGPKTLAALAAGGAPATSAAPATVKSWLRLTRTTTKDTSGCFRLKLDYVFEGAVRDSLFVVSGQPKRQFFRSGKESVRGSYEPLPSGRWRIHDIIWAGARDVYDKRVHKEGIGPAKIPLEYIPKNGTRRDLIQIHIDWNRSTSPGTAGCVGVHSIADFKRLVGWLRESDPRELWVEW